MTGDSSDQKIVQFLLALALCARNDIHAVRWTDSKGKSGYRPEHSPVNEDTIRHHLASVPAIGVYPLQLDMTRMGVIDFDDHDELLTADEVRDKAVRVVSFLREKGMKPISFRSGGGRGIHVWIVWSSPQRAKDVRQLLCEALVAATLKEGTGGLNLHEAEVFPKQDKTKANGYGNLIALPLARNSVPLAEDLTVIGDLTAWSPPELAAFFSPNAPSYDDRPIATDDDQKEGAEGNEQVPETITRLPGDEDEVKAALRHISAKDRETWIRVGHALKNVFGDEGFRIFHEWSRSGGDKYRDEEDCLKTWRSLKPRSQIGLGTIFHLARKGGWNGPSNMVVRQMNARFAVLTHSNRTLVIVKNGDLRPEDEFVTLTKPVFLDRVKTEKARIEKGESTAELAHVGPYWFSHPLRDSYHRLDFDPSRPPGGNAKTWNMWKGFGVAPAAGDWSLLKAHILDNICSGDGQKYEWLLNWMALGVQRPGHVMGTAPVMVGKPGTGKGILAHAYGKLWGGHYTTITQVDHVSGKFNAHLFAKRFVFIDEGMFGGDRRNAGVIKTRITEPYIMLEQKGVDPFKLKNRMIFMVASNEESVVPADIGDRRWMIFNVSEAHQQDREYFAAIMSQLETGGYEAMLHELLQRDVSAGPDPEQTIKNHDLFGQIIRAQPVHVRYVYHVLHQGRLPQNLVAGSNVTTIRAMWQEMQETQPGHKYMSMDALGQLLSKIFVAVRKKQNGVYLTPDGRGQRSTQYVFPPLGEARTQFERYIGCPIPWSPEIREWQSDQTPITSTSF